MKTTKMMRVALVALAALPVAGAGASDHGRARELRERGEIVPLERLIEQAQKAHEGRLIEAELEREGGRYVYELEVVDREGNVWELRYDAETGEPIERARGERDD